MILSFVLKYKSSIDRIMKNCLVTKMPCTISSYFLKCGAMWVLFAAASILLSCGDPEKESVEASPEKISERSSGVPEIDELTKMIADNPDNPELYHNRATIYYERGVMREAIRDWARAMDLDSLNPEYYHRLSDAFMDDNAPMLAIETMEEVINLYPERVPSLLKLGEFYLIVGYFDEAIQSFNRVLVADPNNPDALFMKGLTFRDQGDTSRALRFLQSTIDVDPGMTDAYLLLGQIHMEMDNPIAERYFKNAIRVKPDDPVMYHALAQYLHFTDRLEEALEEYRKMHVQFPSYAEGFYNAGLIYMELDALDQAYDMFDMAVQIRPALSRGYYYRGLIYERKGNFERAFSEYEQALTLAPNFSQAAEAMKRMEAELLPEN